MLRHAGRFGPVDLPKRIIIGTCSRVAKLPNQGIPLQEATGDGFSWVIPSFPACRNSKLSKLPTASGAAALIRRHLMTCLSRALSWRQVGCFSDPPAADLHRRIRRLGSAVGVLQHGLVT